MRQGRFPPFGFEIMWSLASGSILKPCVWPCSVFGKSVLEIKGPERCACGGHTLALRPQSPTCACLRSRRHYHPPIGDKWRCSSTWTQRPSFLNISVFFVENLLFPNKSRFDIQKSLEQKAVLGIFRHFNSIGGGLQCRLSDWSPSASYFGPDGSPKQASWACFQSPQDVLNAFMDRFN